MAAGPDTTACGHCGGDGYVLEGRVRASARAARCSCQQGCRRCNDTGYTLVPAGNGTVAQTCTCRDLDERIALFNRACIPAALAKASFASYVGITSGQSSAKRLAEEATLIGSRQASARGPRSLSHRPRPARGTTTRA